MGWRVVWGRAMPCRRLLIGVHRRSSAANPCFSAPSANLQLPPISSCLMRKGMRKFLLLAAATVAFAAPPAYKAINKIKIGGPPRWDYAYLDSANHRLYVSHATQTEVVDTATDKLVGTIPDTKGVHGIAIANDLGKGFTSDGTDNDVTVFDLKTLAVLSKVKTGQNPDAIIYEPVTHRVFTFHGRSKDATAIDAKTGDVIAASIPVGGKPEFAQVDGKGHIYVNIEDTNEIIEVDAKNALVAKRFAILHKSWAGSRTLPLPLSLDPVSPAESTAPRG